MTPEQIVEDNERKKQVEEINQWYERQRKVKDGDSKAIAEEKEARKALHKRIWEGAEKPKVEKGQSSNRIVEAEIIESPEKPKEAMEKTQEMKKGHQARKTRRNI